MPCPSELFAIVAQLCGPSNDPVIESPRASAVRALVERAGDHEMPLKLSGPHIARVEFEPDGVGVGAGTGAGLGVDDGLGVAVGFGVVLVPGRGVAVGFGFGVGPGTTSPAAPGVFWSVNDCGTLDELEPQPASANASVVMRNLFCIL